GAAHGGARRPAELLRRGPDRAVQECRHGCSLPRVRPLRRPRDLEELGVVHTLSSGDHSLHPDVSIWAVIWSGILYVGSNLAVYPAALFTVHRQTRLRQTVIAGLLAGLLMTIPWFLTYFALMGFYPREDIFGAAVPWLEMLGAEAAWVMVVFGVVVGWTLV